MKIGNWSTYPQIAERAKAAVTGGSACSRAAVRCQPVAKSRATQYVRSVEVDWDSVESRDEFPFCLQVFRDLGVLRLHPAVTYVVGENGTGKSTLLEGIASALEFNPEGGTRNFSFHSRVSHSNLHYHLEVRKEGIPRDGFFLRAETTPPTLARR